MAEPSLPVPPSVEDTQPTAKRAVPPHQAEPKPPKKLDPSVVVAIIGGIVTITTAILSSPLLVAIVNQLRATAIPSPTTIALMIPTSTLAGAEIATPLPALTSAAPGEMVLLSTPVETTILTPTATTESSGSLFNCIAADTWTPYPANLNPAVSDRCWELSDWGFSTPSGQFLIDHNPAQNQQRGIYMPISGDMDIHFTIQIDQFRIRSFDTAFLTFGIVQREPFSVFSGGFLSYSQSQPGAADIQVLVSGSNQATQHLPSLAFGVKQEVTLSVRGALLTVYLDGQPAGEAVNLTSGERAVWIGYVLPRLGTLEAVVDDFVLQSQ